MPRTRKRSPLLVSLGALAVSVALLAGGWQLAVLFQSPAQREAASKPPSPEPVTAAVTSGRLATTVTARARLQRATTQSVAVPSSSAMSVVTKTPVARGAAVTAGQALLEVNGRPIFALPGAFAFYRDLEPGMSGPDVAELQTGLNAAGFEVGTDGRLGPETERAVRALYERSGYDVRQGQDDKTSDRTNGTSSADPATGQSTSGPPAFLIPASEFAIIGQLPAYLVSAPAIGSTVTSETRFAIEEGPVVAVAQVADSVAARLRQGLTATLALPEGAAKATVSAIADVSPPAEAGNGSAGGGEKSVTLVADSEGLPASSLHASVLAEITISVTTDSGLIVPSIAVVADADGAAHVVKRTSAGRFRQVPVTELGVLDGRSAVKPIRAGDLKTGDEVKVG